MDYLSAKYINPQNGLMVERADGIFFYCAPDHEEYSAIVAYFGDDLEPYVDDSPSPEEALTAQMRRQRDAWLVHLDSLISNPLRWAEYTAEQQAAFAAYRQALLDVPQQDGFPEEIDWPVLPSINT